MANLSSISYFLYYYKLVGFGAARLKFIPYILEWRILPVCCPADLGTQIFHDAMPGHPRNSLLILFRSPIYLRLAQWVS